MRGKKPSPTGAGCLRACIDSSVLNNVGANHAEMLPVQDCCLITVLVTIEVEVCLDIEVDSGSCQVSQSAWMTVVHMALRKHEPSRQDR